MSTFFAPPDPGYTANPAAPVGSEDWAKRIRVTLVEMVEDLPKLPARAKGYFDLVRDKQAWKLMCKKDGTYFTGFDEFCEAPVPYGLGRPFAVIRPFLEAALAGTKERGREVNGQKALALVAAPPDRRTENGLGQPRDDRGRLLPAPTPPETPVPLSAPDSRHDGGNRIAPTVDRTVERLRAVSRAPEEAQSLYRTDLLSQAVAAKLGPKKPTPEIAAKVVAATRAAEAAVKAAGPGADKREVRKAANNAARAVLGTPKRTALERVLAAARALSPGDQRALIRALETDWESQR